MRRTARRTEGDRVGREKERVGRRRGGGREREERLLERLKMNRDVEAQQFDCVTIYFSDIVGFTEISARTSPTDVFR